MEPWRGGTGSSRLREHVTTPEPPTASDHPPTWKFEYPIFHAETRTQWRTWLELHHASTRGVWLCSWRNTTTRPRCPYPDAVEEAICFGWIDSTGSNFDDERSLQMFTPRRPKSPWTRLNRQRAADMEDSGLMTEAGRRAIAAAKANGWWTIADQVEDLEEPLELATALNRDPNARSTWDGFPPSARKQMLWWVVSAARDATRSARIAHIVAEAAAGRRARG
ncbi:MULTISPECIES: YdeI family protein [unclassified Rhodococcus (in: high G+C Gram-positive bacteria)]|uniref:YdeI/OmpD-associated family protein n=1 Tax=unclassified Rhodococcus (in: high G+C Gram-positive bacteria) TaxID=192944 RepID=UPI00211B6192|nr:MULTISPECIES: YdeI/OmpD-associated family protein [unclassified Rhodococcus (in: high G+C Gram-positive bacteria)]